MNHKIYLFSLAIATILAFVSCADDVSQDSGSYVGVSPLAVYASINGNASTRAARTEIDDVWSYTGFAENDDMGFYSSGGRWPENNGKEDFVNQKLRYDGTKFSDPDDTEFSPIHMNGSQIFMYFPYDENIDKESGMPLRDNTTPPARCVDFLSSNSITLEGVVNGKDVALFGAFEHTFSELIIMRGEGFDSPPEGCERITVVLSEPYTHIKINYTSTDDTWSCTPELFFSGDSDKKEEARRWDAWKGGNYGITTQNPVGTPAWYVIVPTLPGKRSLVEYIELYDNEGNLLHVSSLRLSGGNTKYVDSSWRYPMEITMKELVPTVNPFPIIPWEKDVDLTDSRKRGINNEDEFVQWVLDYNVYQHDPTDQEKISTLLKYGDTFTDNNGDSRTWHFYLLSDLDLSDYDIALSKKEGEPKEVIIQELRDTLDGISTTLVNSRFINHTIKGLQKSFINKLAENGVVQNIDFIEPEVINSESSTTPAGIIANSMEGAAVINCTIDNGTMFNPAGPAGMITGTMKDGKIIGCTVSGFLKAGSTAPGTAAELVGKEPEGNCTISGNNVKMDSGN